MLQLPVQGVEEWELGVEKFSDKEREIEQEGVEFGEEFFRQATKKIIKVVKVMRLCYLIFILHLGLIIMIKERD